MHKILRLYFSTSEVRRKICLLPFLWFQPVLRPAVDIIPSSSLIFLSFSSGLRCRLFSSSAQIWHGILSRWHCTRVSHQPPPFCAKDAQGIRCTRLWQHCVRHTMKENYTVIPRDIARRRLQEIGSCMTDSNPAHQQHSAPMGQHKCDTVV